MNDEPLYCPKCGQEIGPDHKDCDYEDGPIPRHSRYCEICGIIPGVGGECEFYKAGGNNTGCEATL
jgi:hypothetical protein